MKCVIDSNYLQSPELRSFLQLSRSNRAVLADYAFLEAIKDDTLASVYKSLALLVRFPEQVVVLKTTWEVCGLHGGSRGLQRRLVDIPRTSEFGIFCKALHNSQHGERSMQQELLRLGREATAHLQGVRADAPEFAAIGLEAAKIFSREEQHQVLTTAALPINVLRKLAQACVWQSEMIFANHTAVRRSPTREELPNTYIFRSSLCHLLLAVKWAYSGGASPNPDRLRNDMIDTHFASYSTYFDGLLSNDKTALLVARQARVLLPKIAQILMPLQR